MRSHDDGHHWLPAAVERELVSVLVLHVVLTKVMPVLWGLVQDSGGFCRFG